MALIETCLVDHNGELGWGLISQGVLCPTISVCKSDGVAAALGKHGYPGHTVLQWADDAHSHDATRHKSVPWTRQVWPPGAAEKLPPTVKEKPVLFPPPEPPLVQIEQPFKAQIGDLPPAVQVGDPPPRKSLLVRRPLVTVNNPPPRVEPALKPPDPIPAPAEPVNNGVLVAKAAPVAADTAADNTRVYGRPLTLAEKLAARKAGLL